MDLDDRGSHPDLSFDLMERSIALLGACFGELRDSALRGEPLALQLALAQRAEQRMLAQLGTNTHRGALFLGGLLLLGLPRTGPEEERGVRAGVSSAAREVAALASPRPRATHGASARRRFRVGGILREVEEGLPSVFEVALPAFRAAVARGADHDAASFCMLARLMQTVEDTTALHRCGSAGLARLREDGARLERLVPRGEHLAFLRERNACYRRMNLTMGGVADLLGVALGWLAYRGEVPSEPLRASDR